MQPQVVAATSATMVLISSAAATLNFWVMDLLLVDYALWAATFGFIGTLLGSTGVSYLVKKYQRASIIVIFITVLIAAATILLLIVGTEQVLEDLRTGKHMHFHAFCP